MYWHVQLLTTIQHENPYNGKKLHFLLRKNKTVYKYYINNHCRFQLLCIIGLTLTQARPFGFKPKVFDGWWDKWQSFQSALTFVQALATLANLSSTASRTEQPMLDVKSEVRFSVDDISITTSTSTVAPSAPENIPIPIPQDEDEDYSTTTTSNPEPVPLSMYGSYLDPVDGMLPTSKSESSTGIAYQASSSNNEVLDADLLNRLTQILYQDEVDNNQSKQNRIVGVNFDVPVASLSYSDQSIPSQTQNVQSQGYYYAN